MILDTVTDDVDWASDTASTAAPWYGDHHGKDGVAGFFEAFGSTMEVQQFEPFSFAANDSEVHAMVRLRSTRRANGASVSMNLHHFFQFRDGKICYYRGTEGQRPHRGALPRLTHLTLCDRTATKIFSKVDRGTCRSHTQAIPDRCAWLRRR